MTPKPDTHRTTGLSGMPPGPATASLFTMPVPPVPAAAADLVRQQPNQHQHPATGLARQAAQPENPAPASMLGGAPHNPAIPPQPTSPPTGQARTDRTNLETPTAHQASERDRLLGLCRSLRTSHRCPGRCVLTVLPAELRRGGLAAFRHIVKDNSP